MRATAYPPHAWGGRFWYGHFYSPGGFTRPHVGRIDRGQCRRHAGQVYPPRRGADPDQLPRALVPKGLPTPQGANSAPSSTSTAIPDLLAPAWGGYVAGISAPGRDEFTRPHVGRTVVERIRVQVPEVYPPRAGQTTRRATMA